MAQETEQPILDAQQAAFLQRRVSISVATRDESNQPAVVRAVGCRVSPERGRVTVFLSVPRSGEVIANLRANGVIAAVFNRPSTHETLQLKGRDAAIGPIGAEDRAVMAAYRDSFVEDLGSIGYTEAFAKAVIHDIEGEVVAATFTPESAYTQTPGPQAGHRLDR